MTSSTDLDMLTQKHTAPRLQLSRPRYRSALTSLQQVPVTHRDTRSTEPNNPTYKQQVTASVIAVDKKADRTVYDVQYSFRTEPPKVPRLE